MSTPPPGSTPERWELRPVPHDVPGAGYYMLAIILPPVGFVTGVVCASRDIIGPALALWATSLVIAPIVWAMILFALVGSQIS
jgi:hypothetical protein